MKDRSILLLRIAIAFAFLYPSIDAAFHPDAWIGFFPPFLLNHVPSALLLLAWGIGESVIGLWILSGKRIFVPSTLATLFLCAIVVFNLGALEIVFRDVSLALVAAALALESYGNKRYTNHDSA